jgi:hypothetical protein
MRRASDSFDLSVVSRTRLPFTKYCIHQFFRPVEGVVKYIPGYDLEKNDRRDGHHQGTAGQFHGFLWYLFAAADDIHIDRAAVMDELVNDRTEYILLPSRAQGLSDNDPGDIVFLGVINCCTSHIEPEKDLPF